MKTLFLFGFLICFIFSCAEKTKICIDVKHDHEIEQEIKRLTEMSFTSKVSYKKSSNGYEILFPKDFQARKLEVYEKFFTRMQGSTLENKVLDVTILVEDSSYLAQIDTPSRIPTTLLTGKGKMELMLQEVFGQQTVVVTYAVPVKDEIPSLTYTYGINSKLKDKLGEQAQSLNDLFGSFIMTAKHRMLYPHPILNDMKENEDIEIVTDEEGIGRSIAYNFTRIPQDRHEQTYITGNTDKFERGAMAILETCSKEFIQGIFCPNLAREMTAFRFDSYYF